MCPRSDTAWWIKYPGDLRTPANHSPVFRPRRRTHCVSHGLTGHPKAQDGRRPWNTFDLQPSDTSTAPRTPPPPPALPR